MRKKILFIFTFLMLFVGIRSVNAYTYSLKASNNTVTVGSNVSITLSTNDVMGFYQITSSNNSVLAGNGGDAIDTGSAYSKTYNFTAKSAGTATITVSPTGAGLNVYSTEEALNSRSITINVVEKNTPKQIDVNKTYSKDNSLTNLEVDNYELVPEFSKDVLEYTVNLDVDVEKINVKGVASDKNANVKGLGEVSVSEGNNTIEITVVAENGNERVYKINAIVEDRNPIEVKVDGKKYTVLKKISDIDIPKNFEEKNVTINDLEVMGLFNQITGYTLVALKDEEGNIGYFIYDSTNYSFKPYKELTFNSNIVIYPKKPKKILDGFKLVKLDINNIKVDAYQSDTSSNYYLIYGINVDNNEENWYKYDKNDNSIQRYDYEELDNLKKENHKYLMTTYIMTCTTLLLLLSIMILIFKIRNVKR